MKFGYINLMLRDASKLNNGYAKTKLGLPLQMNKKRGEKLNMHYFFILIGQLFKFTILQTVSNQEVTLKILMSMLLIAQRLHVGASSELCEMNKLFYNNVIKGIRHLDKKHLCLYRKKFVQVRAFERYFP